MPSYLPFAKFIYMVLTMIIIIVLTRTGLKKKGGSFLIYTSASIAVSLMGSIIPEWLKLVSSIDLLTLAALVGPFGVLGLIFSWISTLLLVMAICCLLSFPREEIPSDILAIIGMIIAIAAFFQFFGSSGAEYKTILSINMAIDSILSMGVVASFGFAFAIRAKRLNALDKIAISVASSYILFAIVQVFSSAFDPTSAGVLFHAYSFGVFCLSMLSSVLLLIWARRHLSPS